MENVKEDIASVNNCQPTANSYPAILPFHNILKQILGEESFLSIFRFSD